MTTDRTRNGVWQELLDAARLVRYYEALSDRYRRNHFVVRFLLLAAAASGVAALLDLLPPGFQLAAGGLVALLVVWDAVSDYARKAAILHAIGLECDALEDEWRELWADIEDRDIDDAEVWRRNRRLARRLSEVTGWAGLVDVREDRKLNLRCEADAHRVTAARHAV